MSLATKLNENSTASRSNFKDFLPPGNMQSIFMEDCSGAEVESIISEMQNGKSSDIPISVIKKTSKIISPILSLHFNHLIKVGKFSDELKNAKIAPPIHKKEDEQLLQNYRPISTDQLYQFWEKFLRKSYIFKVI